MGLAQVYIDWASIANAAEGVLKRNYALNAQCSVANVKGRLPAPLLRIGLAVIYIGLPAV